MSANLNAAQEQPQEQCMRAPTTSAPISMHMSPGRLTSMYWVAEYFREVLPYLASFLCE